MTMFQEFLKEFISRNYLPGVPYISFDCTLYVQISGGEKVLTCILCVYRPVAGPSEDHLSGLYSVTGMTVGHTTLTAFAHLPNGQMLNSASKPIEVDMFICSYYGQMLTLRI